MDGFYKNKLVTIIVPIYNSFQYIDRCLQSIQKQTYNNIEVLLIDDGSNDLSSTIYLEYCKVDKRFKFFKKSNGGVSSARNLGLENATGEYVIFIDSDDYVTENHVETLVSHMTNYDVAIIGYQEIGVSNKVQQKIKQEIIEKKQLIKSLLADRNINNSPCNKIYKKEILDRHKIYFYENIQFGEDLVFNMEYFLNIRNAFVTGKVTYMYQKYPESATGAVSDQVKFLVRLTDLDSLRVCLFILPREYTEEAAILIKRLAKDGSNYYRLSKDLKMDIRIQKGIKNTIDFYIKSFFGKKLITQKNESRDKILVIMNRYFPLIARYVYFLARKN